MTFSYRSCSAYVNSPVLAFVLGRRPSRVPARGACRGHAVGDLGPAAGMVSWVISSLRPRVGPVLVELSLRSLSPDPGAAVTSRRHHPDGTSVPYLRAQSKKGSVTRPFLVVRSSSRAG